jgi:hypothetical protein
MAGAGGSFKISNVEEKPNHKVDYDVNVETFEKTKTAVNKIITMSDPNFQSYNELDNKEISLPWIKQSTGDLLEWYIRLVYNGQEFFEEIELTIWDFQEQFLKHPEYGKIMFFDVDSDPDDDVEVIIGFYWSIIKHPDGHEEKSLELRYRVRQLPPAGDNGEPGIEDITGELEVWSELHVNWGLVKETAKNKPIERNPIRNIINKLIQRLSNSKIKLFNTLFSRFKKDEAPVYEPLDVTDADYFSIGTGYRSPEGEEIPRYTEKRFAFAKDRLFSPTIFQNKMDPGNAIGEDPIEILYGFRSYEAATSTKKYDIEFSVEFEPAVYLINKFIPLEGYVYHYFDQKSKRNDDTKVTFASNIISGSGKDVTLSLEFDKIDDTIARAGRWMSFDVDMKNFDLDPLDGKFTYKASNKFSVGVVVNAPGFVEKIKINNIPTQASFEWDVDASIVPGALLKTEVSGFADLSMNSNLGSIVVYYPKTTEEDPDEAFLEVVDIPSVRAGGTAKLHIDIDNFQNSNNWIYGKVYQTSSSSLDRISVYLQEIEDPILELTGFPSSADGEAGLYWNQLRGHAKASTSGTAGMNIEIEYGSFIIRDTLSLKPGFIRTDFKIANSGYFGLDTSNEMVSNQLYFKNEASGDEIELNVGKVEADDFWLDWYLDSSGNIKDIGFRGIIDTLRGLHLDLDYNGRLANVELDWVLGQTGHFDIYLDQGSDLTIDFGEFVPSSDVYFMDGSITLSSQIDYDMSWQWKQGSSVNDPGHFTVNEHTVGPNIKHFDFEFTYNDKYGVRVDLNNLEFYVDLEWWKGDRLLPYVWLDFYVSADDFSLDLLWTNINGETQWYNDVQDW